MDNWWAKLGELLTNPEVAVPFWGAVGGGVRVVLTNAHSIFSAVVCVVLGAVFAHLFSTPIVEYFELPDSSTGGVGAVLGILSYEIAQALLSIKAQAIYKIVYNTIHDYYIKRK